MKKIILKTCIYSIPFSRKKTIYIYVKIDQYLNAKLRNEKDTYPTMPGGYLEERNETGPGGEH